MTLTASFEQAIRASGAMRCLECGKCTAICPLVRFDGGFSPRVTVGRALLRRDQDLLRDDRLWTCLNCLQCSQVCPANVDYSSLTTAVRSEARGLGEAAICTHGEAIHVWMRLMTDPGLRQNRLEWLKSEIRQTSSVMLHPSSFTSPLATSATSDTLYFVGCAPYYDALFEPLGVSGTNVARASVHALNALGIEPKVLPDERCCGHDLLWEGDVDRFLQLARLNAEMIKASCVKRVVSACPECVRTLKVDYPAHGIQLNAQIVHLSELLATSAVPFSRNSNHDIRVTFHDPCRLGRHLGIYDAPRQILTHMGYHVVEMRHNRRNATCCGTNGWTHCGAANKAIQVQRLAEAKSIGADLMVTACLKCQIHFKCALQDEELRDKIGIEMVDLAELAAMSIES